LSHSIGSDHDLASALSLLGDALRRESID
jgi:hypothetical protein